MISRSVNYYCVVRSTIYLPGKTALCVFYCVFIPSKGVTCPSIRYEACMDVTDSDHKPVRCIFGLEIAQVDESIRRQEFEEITGFNENIKRMLEELCKVPETIVSTNNIILQNQDTSILRITNKSGKENALFEIISEGQSTIEDGRASNHHPRGSFGFPRWLQVRLQILKMIMNAIS